MNMITLTKDEAGVLSCAGMVALAAVKGQRESITRFVNDLYDLWGGADALASVLKKVADQASASDE